MCIYSESSACATNRLFGFVAQIKTVMDEIQLPCRSG